MSKTLTPVKFRCIKCETIGDGNTLRLSPQDGVMQLTLPQEWQAHTSPNSKYENVYFTCPIHSKRH